LSAIGVTCHGADVELDAGLDLMKLEVRRNRLQRHRKNSWRVMPPTRR